VRWAPSTRPGASVAHRAARFRQPALRPTGLLDPTRGFRAWAPWMKTPVAFHWSRIRRRRRQGMVGGGAGPRTGPCGLRTERGAERAGPR